MNKNKIEHIVLLVVATISTINIQNQIGRENFNLFSVLLSVFGFLGIAHYFVKPNFLRVFLNIWLVPQTFIIENNVFDSIRQSYINYPIWDLSQVFSIKLGVDFTTDNSIYGLSVNIPIIILLIIVNRVWKKQ